MKAAVLTLSLLLAAMAVPAPAQKIDSQPNDRTRIVHLKTALNHLTVIELTEPVAEVATGSPAFKVEWRENKVFVQPTEADASTNLFIWTATQRLNYELEPAGSVASMDFAVDQAPVHNPEPVSAVLPPPPPPSIADLLLAGKPVVRMLPSRGHASRAVEVWISDLYEKDGRVLIRYAVRNHSAQPYSVGTPQVYELNGVRYPQSLYSLANTQLGDEQIAKLKSTQQNPVQVLDGQSQPSQIAPGQEAVGVVTLQLSSSSRPTVLRLQFPTQVHAKDAGAAEDPTQIAAVLVR